jgi:hypothetical protein
MATRKPASRPGTGPKTSVPKAAKRRPTAAPAKRATAKPVATAASATEPPEAARPKHKLVRDSFTIPKSEYAVLGELKQRAARLARPVKKSELLRAGITALGGMADQSFLSALDAVPSLKTGRPKESVVSAGKSSAKKP